MQGKSPLSGECIIHAPAAKVNRGKGQGGKTFYQGWRVEYFAGVVCGAAASMAGAGTTAFHYFPQSSKDVLPVRLQSITGG